MNLSMHKRYTECWQPAHCYNHILLYGKLELLCLLVHSIALPGIKYCGIALFHTQHLTCLIRHEFDDIAYLTNHSSGTG